MVHLDVTSSVLIDSMVHLGVTNLPFGNENGDLDVTNLIQPGRATQLQRPGLLHTLCALAFHAQLDFLQASVNHTPDGRIPRI